MHSTSGSLLERVRRPDDQDAWSRFVQLYAPLLHFWARRLGLQDPDAGDLVQEVFALLVRKLPEFRYERSKGFRNWLRTVLLNKWREAKRRPRRDVAVGGESDLLTDVAAEEMEEFGEAEYRRFLVHRALEIMKTEFPPKMWQACWEHVVGERPAAEVAAELRIAVGTVYVAKARVLAKLRLELTGLLD